MVIVGKRSDYKIFYSLILLKNWFCKKKYLQLQLICSAKHLAPTERVHTLFPAEEKAHQKLRLWLEQQWCKFWYWIWIIHSHTFNKYSFFHGLIWMWIESQVVIYCCHLVTLVVSRLVSTGNLQNLPEVSCFAYLDFKRPAVEFLFAVRQEKRSRGISAKQVTLV